MGYRSDVVFVFAFEDALQRDAFAAAVANDPQLEPFKEDWMKVDSHELPALRLSLQSVKWYENYAGVQAVEMLRLKAVARGGAWVKARIGEEYDDAEYEHNCDDRLAGAFYPYDYARIVRQIQF